MVSFLKSSPVLQPKIPLARVSSNPQPSRLASLSPDFSLEVLKIANAGVEFLEGAQDYWSSKGLMEGYGEGVSLWTHHLGDQLIGAHPVVQATTGSLMGVGKILGAIPFGLGHWIHQSAREAVDHNLHKGIKTFVSIPIQGFTEGLKFLWQQGVNWSGGNISETTFGVADEVSTTLGTAVLMALGIKSIHTGGTGMIQGLKSIEITLPPLATAHGQVGAAYPAGSMSGLGSLTEGLVYMSGTQDPPGHPPSSKRLAPVDFKQLTKDAAQDKDAMAALGYFAKRGEPEAIAGLLELVKAHSENAQRKLWDLTKEGSESALDGMLQLFRQDGNSSVFGGLYHFAARKPISKVILEFRRLDLEAVLTQAEFQKNRCGILSIKSLAGEIPAVEALAHLAKQGNQKAVSALNDLVFDATLTGNVSARIRAFELLTQTPEIPKFAKTWAKNRAFRFLPVELGTRLLNWLIQESVKDPKIAQALVEGNGRIDWLEGAGSIPEIYASADYRPIFQLAKQDQRYVSLLRHARKKMSETPEGMLKGAELKSILAKLGVGNR